MRRSGASIPRRAAGRAAEQIAAAFLEERGYEVLEKNFTVRQGEVDLIVRRESVLAFVEVRSRTSVSHGTPEETIGPRKVKRVVTAARCWLSRHGDGGLDISFDVVAIAGPLDGEHEIRHLPAAFGAGL